ncbi:MAG: choice-of-anchor J domain-containing protein [Candidatus Limimorpha sp.]
MRKIFLILALCLFAFVGQVSADEVQIGTISSTSTIACLPASPYYKYSISQQIYTSAEIGMAGTINSISFNIYSTASSIDNRAYKLYMANVDKTAFASTIDWVTLTPSDMVFEGSLAPNVSGWFTFTLDNPFEYDGTSNLLVCLIDNTGTWVANAEFSTFTEVNSFEAIYINTDSGTGFDVTTITSSGNLSYFKNVIKLDITPYVSEVEVTPLDLGYRPNNAWSKPVELTLSSTSTPLQVNALDMDNNYFTLENVNVPFVTPNTINVATGNANEGVVEGTLTVLYNELERTAKQFNITANAYNPATGDVWETAKVVSSMPFAENTVTANLYNNYDLPGTAADDKDALYKMTFAQDMMLSANTNGGNAKVAVYEEGFNGVGGPSVDNYYTYEGPQIGQGPIMTWFAYNYSGNRTFFGNTNSNLDMYFGYKISAEVLQTLGFGDCSLISVESAAREPYPYDLYVFRGGEDQPEELIYAQEMGHNAEALSFFHMDIDEPFVLGDDENIWVMLNSNSSYAAYCGKYPTDANGKIYYSFGGQNWFSNGNYTPLIYIRLAELPTGRQVTVNLADLATTSIAAEALEAKDNAVVNGTSKALEYMSMIEERENANNSTRSYGVDNMYVPAGTYYVAMSSSTENFDVEINAEVAPTPVAAQIIAPADGETDVTTPYLLQWIIGDYTTEMQVLLGSQYPPEDVLIDWTDELVETAILANLDHNRTYFVQVNERNTSGVSSSEIVGFTTVIDGPENLVVENTNLYPGEAAVLSWEMNRTFRGYNVYVDGVKYNAQTIYGTTYNVEGLEYNVEQGHEIYVTAVYDEGESLPTNPVYVHMTGNGSVNGKVYELEPASLMEGVTVTFNGVDEYLAEQTFTFTTDANGEYSGELLAGLYDVTASLSGYADITVSNVEIVYNQLTGNVDINIHEFYKPVGQVVAEVDDDETVANVTWSWDPAELFVDFETGDFSQANFDNTVSSYPWVITTSNPYEGTYCMKSSCEGIASAESYIDAIVDVPYDAKVGFYVKTSSETSYDKFYFYIDGVQQGDALSGAGVYMYREYNVTEGTHTYRWKYSKDSSVNSNDDCIYVDNITLYRKDEPTPPVPGQTYDFEDGTLMGWTNIDADGDGNVWQNGMASNLPGHNSSAGMLFSQSYINYVGALTPDNYLVSPTKLTVQDGAAITFWAAAQDASYPSEHYGVAVSTTGNTSANDFTTIWEETMTAKRSSVEAYAKSDIRGTRAQGLWYQKTVDLSAYAGQEIWVAIRHFNCTDWFYLDVDDITLSDGSDKSMANTRTFQNFNVYRRNVLSDEETVLLGMTTGMEMSDNEFATIEAGSYQYGVAAVYDGYLAPEDNRAAAETYTYGFEGSLEGWTNIDADGDGDMWAPTSTLMATGYAAPCHSGSDCAESASYFYTPLTPDNYLVCPTKAQYSQITFWAAAYYTAWPAEHYGVAVSTTGNTDPNDFTTIWEETMTAKGSSTAVKRELNGSKEVGTWYQKTIDLSAYAGQEIWVAIRHFDCTDQYLLLVDDVELTTGGGVLPPTPSIQTLIDEDFEDGMPEDWSMEGTGYAWYIDGEYTGEGALAARVDYNYTGAMSMKFVTPAVDLTDATSATLTFLGHQHTQGVGTSVYGPDPLTVYYRVNSGEWVAMETFTDGQQDYAVFAERSITLPAAALSSSTQLAFAVGSNDGYGAIIDNVVLTGSYVSSTGNESEIVWSNTVDKDMFTTLTVSVVANNGQSVEGTTVEFVNNVEEYTYAATLDATGSVTFDDFRKGEYTYTIALDGYTSCANGDVISIWEEMTVNCQLEENITVVEDLFVSTTGWAKWVGPMPNSDPNPGPTPPTPPTPGEGEWYYYDNGTCSDAIGTGGGTFSWGVMFPAGSYDGNMVTKVAAWDYMSMSGTVTVYNGGTTAPGTAVGTMNVSFAGTQSNFSEFEFAEPVVVDPSQNLWIIFYNASGATYPAACSTDVTGDPNGRWVSIDGIDWMDLANAGIPGYTFMVRAYVAEGAKGEVKEISVNNTYDGGTLAKAGVKPVVASKDEEPRVALGYKVMLDGTYQGDTEYAFYQLDTENLVEGQTYTVSVAAVYATGMSAYTDYEFVYTPCDNFVGATNVAAAQNGSDVVLSWVMPGGTPTPPTPGEGEWYYYDNGTCSDAIGTGGGTFSWGVMFPAGSYDGNMVTKVAAWDYMSMSGTVTVYNGGTTAPGTAVGTMNVSFAGTQSNFSEFEFAEPVVVDPSQNLWIIFYNASGATYPAACSTDVTGDPNGRWVSIDGIDWMDLANAGIPGYTFMVRAYVAEGAKGEVKEISVNNIHDGGTLAKAGRANNRAMWDMMAAFNCTSAGQQGVVTDGEFIYTSSWQTSPTGGYTFYKYDLNGNFVEGFNISGAVGVRDMTTDGEYFYATSGGNEIFILDLANKTKVGSIYGTGLTSRHISYDPERDAFWCGNWSDLGLFDRTGAKIQTGPAPSSAYGSGYFKDSDGVEHLYLFCQPNSDCKVYDYNITTGTLGSSPVFDFASTPGAAGGISGGAFVGAYGDKTCFFGNVQADPNVVGIYELAEGSPVPPTPIAGILGAMVFVDGELITAEPITSNSISISNMEIGEHELCVRVVYADSLYYAMSCPTCAEIETICTPVKDLEGDYIYIEGIYGAYLTWDCEAEPISYKIYRNDMLVAEVSEMEFGDELTNTPGNYTYGVVAVYENCESEMVTVNVNVTNVNENEVVNAIYPNPTNGDLNVYATSMQRITIVNAMGQMVYDQAVSGDSKVIDMRQFEAGVYMVSVVTENGTSVKRVTVIK